MERIRRWLINVVGPFLLAAIRAQIHEELRSKPELEEGHVKLRPEQSAVIFSTDEPGTINGFVNCEYIGGPNTVEIQVYLNSVDPNGDSIKPYLSDSIIIEHTKDNWAPIVSLDPVYAPRGGMVKLTLLTGIATPFYYYVYRD